MSLLKFKMFLIGKALEGSMTMSDIKRLKTLIFPHPEEVPLEYSPEFAEKIIAASREEFHEIDIDEMISQLDAMIAKARARN